jgi:DNA repair protein RadC
MLQEYKLRIKDMSIEERPRERLIAYGPKSLSNAELLAIILRNGTANENVVSLSERLLTTYNIKSLSRQRVNRLKRLSGIGTAKACQIIAAFELGRRLASFKENCQPTIRKAGDIAKIIMPDMSNLKKEHFIGVYLNSRQKLIKIETIFIGSLDTTVIHPREIFEIALSESASALILAHNHPSGDPKPSHDDIKVTKQMIEVGEIMAIPILDHIIVGNKQYISLKEKGFC